MIKKSNLIYKLINYSYYELIYLLKVISFRSFSQLNEDIVIDSLFKKKKNGFYVDVGCYRPIRFSNTFFFYLKRNWKGICIDPQDEFRKKYKLIRPRDKYLNYGVGKKKEIKMFYNFNPKTLSTFSRKSYLKYLKLGYEFNNKKEKKILPLKQITTKKIDLLSIDTEGYELNVLKGIDWRKKPKIIIIETNIHMTKKKNKFLHKFLKKKGMSLCYENSINSIFAAI
tara:strand:- start:404 stop:1081 length:678 start_codon:yes stop_codon:yes gene_type:complete